MIEFVASYLDSASFAQLVPTWGYVMVFLFMAVESSFIPFPSEVVMIPAGFLAARGELAGPAPCVALVIAILAAVAGSLAGAFANYYLALWLGKPFLLRYGKWFFVKPAPLERACEVFNKYGAATTLVCRLVPVIRQLISIPAGISRMPIGSFTLFTALGAGAWTAILALVGYGFGKSAEGMTYVELVKKGKAAASAHLPSVIAVAVLLAAAYLLVSKLVSGRSPKSE